MASFNKVLLMGNLVRDPELRVTPSGLSVCRCTIACSRNIRAEAGNREETTFIDIESFGKQAETVAKHFTKGKPIFVEGRLRLNEWQNSSGEKRSKLLVVMENFVFVGPNASVRPDGEAANLNYEKVSETKNTDASSFDNRDEDVPF